MGSHAEHFDVVLSTTAVASLRNSSLLFTLHTTQMVGIVTTKLMESQFS